MLEKEFVNLCFGVAVVATAVLTRAGMASRAASDAPGSKATDERFRAFQRNYLVVYLMAMMADWLQGPYVYALYDSYGFTKEDNAILFTAGFGSSAVFGTMIGSLADSLGRRKFAGLYCVLYVASCCTKHVNNFSVLMLGRLTGGIATSLLSSVFDSWMVSEHNRRNFGAELLGVTFALANTGNSIVAILAGEVGQVAADATGLTRLSDASDVYYGGFCAPFDLAIALLVVCLAVMFSTWSENFGLKSSASSLGDTIKVAFRTISTQPAVLYCGAVCSFFEASMFIFVFNWTPALTEEGAPKPPYGHIFATFMAMSMLGSQAFSLESGRRSVESIGRYTLLLAAACHVVPVLTSSAALRFLSFLAFEMCVGLYFPMMGTMKGMCVPEESRAAIYNMYRVPLNVIVVSTLVTNISVQTAFMLTSGLLLAAVYFQTKLIGLRGNAQYRPVGADSEFGLDDDPLGIDGQPTGAGSELTTVVGNKS